MPLHTLTQLEAYLNCTQFSTSSWITRDPKAKSGGRKPQQTHQKQKTVVATAQRNKGDPLLQIPPFARPLQAYTRLLAIQDA